jgi:ribonuclease E
MLINAVDPEESRIAVVEDGVLQELHVELASREAYLGNIYKGKVVNIEPSIGAAFVAFGGRVNGFLHVSDVLPSYGRPEFVLDDVIEGRARVDVDDGPESMQQALADDDEEDAPAGQGDGVAEAVAVVEESNVTIAEDDGGDVEPADPHDEDAPEAGSEPEPKSGPDADESAEDRGPRGGSEGGKRRGFGHGVDERPLAMAASGDAGPGEDAGGDGPSAPASAGEASGDARPPRDAAEGAAGGNEPAGEPAGGGEGRRRRDRRDRRERDNRTDRRPRGPRPTIDQLLRKGQEVVVQITKEGIGSKGPTLTTYVSLPGRCLVLMPSLPKCGVSRKIEDGRERKRLKRIVRELDETGSGGIGFIVRTAGINKSLQDLERDRDYLKKIWEMVAQRLKVTRAPALLYQESDLVLKAMRDQFTPDIADVVVDSEDVFLRIRDFADKLMPHMAERIKNHSMTTPLFHHFGIEKEVEALYQPKVDLPNGASIVIDQTEALVAIDVNSGKYKAGGDSDETAYRTNLDAIPEIVRQLRLRDLGGLIIIDFIDMSHEKHRRGVEKRLIDALRGDRARIKVGRISPFGMLEITRQRVGPGLKRTVFMQCPHCKGAGWSRTVQSKALSVLREVRALVNLKGYSVLQVFVAPPVTDYLVNYKRRGVLELEDAVGKSILFRPEPSYPIDVVHYRFLTGDGQEARIAIPAGLGVKA